SAALERIVGALAAAPGLAAANTIGANPAAALAVGGAGEAREDAPAAIAAASVTAADFGAAHALGAAANAGFVEAAAVDARASILDALLVRIGALVAEEAALSVLAAAFALAGAESAGGRGS